MQREQSEGVQGEDESKLLLFPCLISGHIRECNRRLPHLAAVMTARPTIIILPSLSLPLFYLSVHLFSISLSLSISLCLFCLSVHLFFCSTFSLSGDGSLTACLAHKLLLLGSSCSFPFSVILIGFTIQMLFSL